jgi:hypothetical protein
VAFGTTFAFNVIPSKEVTTAEGLFVIVKFKVTVESHPFDVLNT